MRVVVTGAAGFIGSHVVRALEARGDEVHGFDKKDGPGSHTITDLAGGSKPFVRVMAHAGIDVVVHCAGSASTPSSVSKPLETFTDNVTTAALTLDEARLREVPIIITSSVKARDGQTPYGAAKRMVELWAREYRSAYQFPVIINRPGTIYGPGQEGSTESGWIAWFLKANLESLPVVINGDGSNMRDLLHVNDYVELLLKQIDNPLAYGDDIYDVGGGWDNAVTVLQMAEHLGLDYTFGPPRYGDAQVYVALNDAPDWIPTTHWRDGIRELVK